MMGVMAPPDRRSVLASARWSRSASVGVDDRLVALYRSHYRSLVRLAALLVDDLATAEEVVQDAFVALSRGPGPSEAAKAPAYLRAAVVNRARSELRKRGVRRRHLRTITAPGADPAADEPALAADEHARVLAALATLPPRQREVLVLRFYEDLSEAEIAAALGISPGSVKTHAHRGLAALESRLAHEDWR